jgi:hypothetical protein
MSREERGKERDVGEKGSKEAKRGKQRETIKNCLFVKSCRCATE